MSGRTHLATRARLRAAALVGGLTTALLALALLGPAAAHALPPIIVCPASMTVEADQPGGANVTPAEPTVSDPDGDPVTITGPTPPAGVYPLGTTTVTYVATDGLETSSCSTPITVRDTTAPSITCPSNITAGAPEGGTVVVPYSAQASDIVGPTTVTLSPPSGTAFSIGTHFVTATATDDSGNFSTCTFTVTVKALPTSKAECKNGGWKTFGIFKNQGECVDLFGT